MDLNTARCMARFEREEKAKQIERENYRDDKFCNALMQASNNNNSSAHKRIDGIEQRIVGIERRIDRLDNNVDSIIKMCYPDNRINPMVSIVNSKANVNSQMNITLTDDQFKEFCRIMQTK